MSLLEFRNTEKTYTLGNSEWTFGPVSLAIKHGEDVAIIGASGSGKSTLLHLAAGFMQLSGGDILFEGKSLSHMSEKEIDLYRRQKIGFVFQDFYLFPEFTLLENVEMPFRLGEYDAQTSRKSAEELLERVGLLKKAGNFPRELSGGERQRGAIARALVHKPKILFADEPTGNLDSKTGTVILNLLKEIHRGGDVTFVIVTHDEKIAELMSRVVTIRDGKLVEDKKITG